MQLTITLGNLEDASVDALIYSTNPNLALTGGVGQALLNKYGYEFQDRLYQQSEIPVETGSVLTTINPWPLCFHCIAVDENYQVDDKIVINMLKECFAACDENFAIQSVALSPIGCGYGNLHVSEFGGLLRQVCKLFDASDLKVTLVTQQKSDYETLQKVLRAFN